MITIIIDRDQTRMVHKFDHISGFKRSDDGGGNEKGDAVTYDFRRLT